MIDKIYILRNISDYFPEKNLIMFDAIYLYCDAAKRLNKTKFLLMIFYLKI